MDHRNHELRPTPHSKPTHHPAPAGRRGLNLLALRATLHCLAGCSIGEILGLVIGNALGWSGGLTVALAVVLAFAFGYAFTLVPLVRSGLEFRRALAVALAADTLSITIMEIIDNAFMLAVPGAMDAPVTSAHFWMSMGGALVLAGLASYPVNRWLIARGQGHAVAHALHGAGGESRDHAGHDAPNGSRSLHAAAHH